MNVLHLFVGRWCFGLLTTAQLQMGRGERQRAAAVQLPASAECYKRNCLQRGNWHTHRVHTLTKPRTVGRGQRCSNIYCRHMKIPAQTFLFCCKFSCPQNASLLLESLKKKEEQPFGFDQLNTWWIKPKVLFLVPRRFVNRNISPTTTRQSSN